jgi:hypothetical protein
MLLKEINAPKHLKTLVGLFVGIDWILEINTSNWFWLYRKHRPKFQSVNLRFVREGTSWILQIQNDRTLITLFEFWHNVGQEGKWLCKDSNELLNLEELFGRVWDLTKTIEYGEKFTIK